MLQHFLRANIQKKNLEKQPMWTNNRTLSIYIKKKLQRKK